jgi:hypothetical protein
LILYENTTGINIDLWNIIEVIKPTRLSNAMTVFHPPRHIVWSTNHLDLSDPFQRRWYLRQVLLHGQANDLRTLDLGELERELDGLDLPLEIYTLWKRLLESHHAGR